jgi:hypothetical protein
MTDVTLKRKLEKLVALANELDDEAKRRYGKEGFLFFEAEGGFHIMSGDCDGSTDERQKFSKFRAKSNCTMGAGAW